MKGKGLLGFVVVGLLLASRAPARAAWAHGNYSVNTVVTAIGNYVYSAGSTGGNVEAISLTTKGWSEVDVEFGVTYTALGTDPPATINGKGDLHGSKSGTGFAKAGCSSAWAGWVYRNTGTDGNPFSTTETLGSDTIYPTSVTVYIEAYSKASGDSSNTADATAHVYFTLS